MNLDLAIESLQQALMCGLLVAAPVLTVLFAVSLVVSALQGMTQLHDSTLSIVPKLLAGFGVLLWLLPWMLESLTDYSSELFVNVGRMF